MCLEDQATSSPTRPRSTACERAHSPAQSALLLSGLGRLLMPPPSGSRMALVPFERADCRQVAVVARSGTRGPAGRPPLEGRWRGQRGDGVRLRLPAGRGRAMAAWADVPPRLGEWLTPGGHVEVMSHLPRRRSARRLRNSAARSGCCRVRRCRCRWDTRTRTWPRRGGSWKWRHRLTVTRPVAFPSGPRVRRPVHGWCP